MRYFGIVFILIFSLLVISPYIAFGQTTGPGTGETTGPGTGETTGPGGSKITNPINSSTFAQLMKKIALTVTQIALPLVVVFIIYSGFLFVSARGNEEQLEKAKSTFFWAVIGALLVVGAYAIATAIENFAKQL